MNKMYRRWEGYLNSIQDYKNNDNYSSLWKGMIKDFTVTGKELLKFDEFIETHCRGYSFINRKPLVSRLHETFQILLGGSEHYLEELGVWTSRYPLQKLSYWAANILGKVTGNDNCNKRDIYDWRIFKIWNFLRKESVESKKYLSKFESPYQLKLTFNTLKSVYYYDMLGNNCNFDDFDNLSVMEVGAGTCNFAILVAKHMTNLNYYIVDLPEMILIASHEINKYLPSAKQILPNEVGNEFKTDINPSGINFIFLTPEQTNLIPENKVDLAINIDSLAEMNQDTANSYIDLMYRCLHNGGYIFTANRESREISHENKVSNITAFWKFPFRDTDEIILMEYCQMKDYLTNRRTRNINRLARIIQ